jgi:hypothetical protein
LDIAELRNTASGVPDNGTDNHVKCRSVPFANDLQWRRISIMEIATNRDRNEPLKQFASTETHGSFHEGMDRLEPARPHSRQKIGFEVGECLVGIPADAGLQAANRRLIVGNLRGSVRHPHATIGHLPALQTGNHGAERG